MVRPEILQRLGNKAGNIMAMMPHPERTTNGDAIFRSMHDYILNTQNNLFEKTSVRFITKQPLRPERFVQAEGSEQFLIKLIITDNQALTVQNTLRQLGFPVTVKRCEHWEIESDSVISIERLKRSGLLYSERKQQEISRNELKADSGLSYLVRPRR